MDVSYSEVWSTLGMGALSYFWGLTAAEVDALPMEDQRRLVKLTTLVYRDMSQEDRQVVVERLQPVPAEELLPNLLLLAAELVPRS